MDNRSNTKRQQLIDMTKGTPQPFYIEHDADTGLYYPTMHTGRKDGGIRLATFAHSNKAKAAAALHWLQKL